MNKKTILIAIIICLLFLTGCEKYNNISENSNNYPPIHPVSEDKLEVTLYYPNNGMEYLSKEVRVLPRAEKNLEENVINELIKGTNSTNLKNIIPANTKVISVDVIDGTCYLSLSEGIINKEYSEKEEAFVLYSIVNTLTSLVGIRKVQILINGEARDVLSKHYSIREPLEYSDLIVNKEYVSPIFLICEYYDATISKRYEDCLNLLNIRDEKALNYHTLQTYLVSKYEGLTSYDIKNYVFDKYNYSMKTNINIFMYFETSVIKDIKEEFNLVYKDGNFKIDKLLK